MPHLTDVNPAALTADGKPGFCIHDYILRCFNWIYLAAERWDGHQDVCDGWRRSHKIVKYTTKANATAIIALTASVVKQERAITLSAGCDDFLRQPFKEHIIFATLTKHLGGKYIYEEMQSHNGDNLTKAE
ncbi:MAG: hypothetical protein WCF82_05570 [Microcoleus sp.]